MRKLKFKSDFLNFLMNSFFINFFMIFLYIYIYFSYIQKCLKPYQLNIIKKINEDCFFEKKDIKIMKDIKIILKREKKKRHNMVMNVTKICQKMKNKRLLIIEKGIIE